MILCSSACIRVIHFTQIILQTLILLVLLFASGSFFYSKVSSHIGAHFSFVSVWVVPFILKSLQTLIPPVLLFVSGSCPFYWNITSDTDALYSSACIQYVPFTKTNLHTPSYVFLDFFIDIIKHDWIFMLTLSLSRMIHICSFKRLASNGKNEGLGRFVSHICMVVRK